MSDRKALNIGINRFENYEQFALRGCRHDVENFRRMLVEYLGFSEEDIFDLKDEVATKANIIGTLKALVEDAKQGNCSYVLLHISTHGTQIPDTGGTEVDHMDEAFVPHDISQIGDEWDRDHIIVVDELAEILSATLSLSLLPSSLSLAAIANAPSDTAVSQISATLLIGIVYNNKNKNASAKK